MMDARQECPAACSQLTRQPLRHHHFLGGGRTNEQANCVPWKENERTRERERERKRTELLRGFRGLVLAVSVVCQANQCLHFYKNSTLGTLRSGTAERTDSAGRPGHDEQVLCAIPCLPLLKSPAISTVASIRSLLRLLLSMPSSTAGSLDTVGLEEPVRSGGEQGGLEGRGVSMNEREKDWDLMEKNLE